MTLSKFTTQQIYFTTIVLLFLSVFLFFHFDYRYIDDYKLFIHNDSLTGFLESHRWGFSRIVGNYFFGLLYLPQNNVFLNLSVLLFHFLNGFLIYKILSNSGKTLALFSALFFISIPITSEAFLWALAGQVVYAVFFFLWAVRHYHDNQQRIGLKHSALIVLLFALSISFYEVFILFPFLFVLFSFWRKKHLALAMSLSAISIGYLSTLKLLSLLRTTLTLSQKTTPIPIDQVPERVVRIIRDLFDVFFGRVAVTMYTNSLQDAIGGKVPGEMWAAVGLFVTVSLLFIWIINKERANASKLSSFAVALSLMIGCALVALLTLPVNYFHDLRTYYPFSICLVFLIHACVLKISHISFLYKILISMGVLLICINLLVLKVENSQYVALYQDDWKFIQQFEKDAQNGKTTIIYLPGYDSSRPLETQMNTAYYPATNFTYGTHMLAAPSIKFSLIPTIRLGNRQEIADTVSEHIDQYLVHDFTTRQTVSAAEFLSLESSKVIDLTMMDPQRYLFKDMPHHIKRHDGAVIFEKKINKAFVLHANCGDRPATLEVTLPKLVESCQLSYRLLNVYDTERRTTSDGVDFTLSVNGSVVNSVELQPKDPKQTEKVYRSDITPTASGSAYLSFEVGDGGSKNCNDDKIFIAEPLLRCE